MNESPVICIDIHQSIQHFYISLGLQNGIFHLGTLKLLRFSYRTEWVLDAEFSTVLDGPLSSTCFSKLTPEILDLVVCSAIGYIVVYQDISSDQLTRPLLLKPSTDDALTCVFPLDVDFDGNKELLVGTFSQEVFCYKLAVNSFQELWVKHFEHPIMGIEACDMNNDGLMEIIVVGMYAVSVFSPDTLTALRKLEDVRKYLEFSSISA